jgi:hypothetical protein
VDDLRCLFECFDMLVVSYDAGTYGIQYRTRRDALEREEFESVHGERLDLNDVLKEIAALVHGSISYLDIGRYLLDEMDDVTGVVLWTAPVDQPPPDRHPHIRQAAARIIDAMHP